MEKKSGKKGVRKLVLFSPIEHQPGEPLEKSPMAYEKMIESAIKLAELARNMRTPIKKRIVLYPPTRCGRATAVQLGLLFHSKFEELTELLGEAPHDGIVKDEQALAEILRRYGQEYECIILVARVNHAVSELFVGARLEELLATEFDLVDFRKNSTVWWNKD